MPGRRRSGLRGVVRMTTREIQPYSREQLERMLKDIESDLVERKESFSGKAPKTVREAVCAFANDLPNHHRPGVVFIGARDNGRPVGLEVSDTLLRELSDIKTDGNTVPPPTLTAAKHHLRGADVAVITVWPADSPPVKYRGRIWIRVGPRRAVASAQDERLLNERRRHRDRPYYSNNFTSPGPPKAYPEAARELPRHRSEPVTMKYAGIWILRTPGAEPGK